MCLLGLVERVFLRIGSAETDEQLESCLDRFLPPVLLKLNSSEEAVRKKVGKIVTMPGKNVGRFFSLSLKKKREEGFFTLSETR